MSIAQTCIYDTLESCKYAKYWYGKPVVSKCKDCNQNPNNHPKTQVGTKEEMKDKTSMALKDPILQHGFEIICKNLAELEKENAEFRNIAEFQQSSNMNRYFENKKLKDENTGLKEKLNMRSCQNYKHNNKSCPNDGSCVHYSKWEGYKNPQLTKAKEIMQKLYDIVCGRSGYDWELLEQVEYFISEELGEC